MTLNIRPIRSSDPPIISAAFTDIGWDKPIEQFERYLADHKVGTRHVFVAMVDEEFAGYVTVIWKSGYGPFREAGIPEIQDFNVLPNFRRQGIGSALMNRVEELVRARSNVVGIGVGMYADYGSAQRMYVKRGYVPNGRGLSYDGRVLEPGE